MKKCNVPNTSQRNFSMLLSQWKSSSREVDSEPLMGGGTYSLPTGVVPGVNMCYYMM